MQETLKPTEEQLKVRRSARAEMYSIVRKQFSQKEVLDKDDLQLVATSVNQKFPGVDLIPGDLFYEAWDNKDLHLLLGLGPTIILSLEENLKSETDPDVKKVGAIELGALKKILKALKEASN